MKTKTTKTNLYLACAMACGMTLCLASYAQANLTVNVNHDSDLELNEQVNVDISEQIEAFQREKTKKSLEKRLHREIQSAVEVNDYENLSTKAKEIISKEDFDMKVSAHAKEEQHKINIDQALQDGDYDAYVIEMNTYQGSSQNEEKSLRESFEALLIQKAEKNKFVDYRQIRSKQTQEKKTDVIKKNVLQTTVVANQGTEVEDFEEEIIPLEIVPNEDTVLENDTQEDIVVSEIEENGEESAVQENHASPEVDYQAKKIDESNRDMVVGIIKSVELEKLEKILFKIDATILLIDDETSIDLLKSIKGVIIEVINS